MKQLLTFCCAISCALAASAQNRPSQTIPVAKQLHLADVAAKPASSNLTVGPMSFLDTACSVQLYSATDGGYVSGTNGYGDLQKMMRYTLSDFGSALPATVDTVMAFFGTKYVSGDGNVTAKVYADDGSGAPGALLGTSMPVAVSALDTSGLPTPFIFSAAVPLTTNQFFVSIDFGGLYATGDTAALFSSDECSSVDPDAAWDQFDDESFMKVSSTDNWGLNIEFFILARLTTFSTGVQQATNGALQTKVYPNPASDLLTVSLGTSAPFSVSLKDVTGRTVLTQEVRNGATANLQVASFQAGIYFCEVTQNGRKEVQRIVIQ